MSEHRTRLACWRARPRDREFSRLFRHRMANEGYESVFRRDAETNTPDACATRIGPAYRGVVSHVMKASRVWRVLSATNSITVASSTKPRIGVASGMRSKGS